MRRLGWLWPRCVARWLSQVGRTGMTLCQLMSTRFATIRMTILVGLVELLKTTTLLMLVVMVCGVINVLVVRRTHRLNGYITRGAWTLGLLTHAVMRWMFKKLLLLLIQQLVTLLILRRRRMLLNMAKTSLLIYHELLLCRYIIIILSLCGPIKWLLDFIVRLSEVI